jgi:hypothetical protein
VIPVFEAVAYNSYVFGQAPPIVIPGIIGAIQAAGLATWGYPEPLEGPVILVSNLYQTNALIHAEFAPDRDVKTTGYGRSESQFSPCVSPPNQNAGASCPSFHPSLESVSLRWRVFISSQDPRRFHPDCRLRRAGRPDRKPVMACPNRLA